LSKFDRAEDKARKEIMKNLYNFEKSFKATDEQCQNKLFHRTVRRSHGIGESFPDQSVTRNHAMLDKVLDVFEGKKRLNIHELVLRLQIDEEQAKEILGVLVNLGKLRVEEKGRCADFISMSRVLGCRCSIRRAYGEMYVFNE